MADDNPVTTRNLVDSGLGPLRRFTGILDSTPTEKRIFGEGDNARESERVQLNIRELEVLEAAEPYHFPTYTIQANLSRQKRSRWGVLANSFNELVDQQYSATQLDPSSPEYIKVADRVDLEDAIGKRIGFVMSDGLDGRPQPPSLFDGRAQEDKPTPCWVVYSVEDIGTGGSSGKSALDTAMSLLDGKSLSEFAALALANPAIRADVTLLQAITKPTTAPESFANTMIASGQFTVDAQEVYHKVG
jgi:hypothetical protein